MDVAQLGEIFAIDGTMIFIVPVAGNDVEIWHILDVVQEQLCFSPIFIVDMLIWDEGGIEIIGRDGADQWRTGNQDFEGRIAFFDALFQPGSLLVTPNLVGIFLPVMTSFFDKNLQVLPPANGALEFGAIPLARPKGIILIVRTSIFAH